MTGPAGSAVSAIVLAGGRSSRFGTDKLTAVIGGRSVLELAIDGVGAIATDVVVVLAPGDDRRLRPGVRTAADPEAHGGPLVGLAAGLEVVAEPIAIVAGGDMPSLEPAVLRLMVRTLATAGEGIGAIVLEQRGRAVPLPAVVRTGLATDTAGRLVAGGERSLRSLFDHVATLVVPEGEWRPLDPEARTLRDIDLPTDL